jgi:hypothetical protein
MLLPFMPKYNHGTGQVRINDMIIGYVTDKGEQVMYGKQYYRLYFTGQIDD